MILRGFINPGVLSRRQLLKRGCTHAARREILRLAHRHTGRVCAQGLQAPGPSKESTQPGLYSRPDIYQAVFSYRNVELEVKFLKDSFRKHALGSESGLRSVLDIGCGPGEHAVGLALMGGLEHIVGLDLSQDMLNFAMSNAKSKGAQAQLDAGTLCFVQGDMRSFSKATLPGGRDYDMVTCLLGTFTHLLENTEALQAFSCVAGVLRPGGLFILELGHPGDLFDGSFVINEAGKEIWEVEKTASGNKLLVEWGDETDEFDPISQVVDRLVCITEFKGQHGEEVMQAIEEHVPARQYTAQEVDLLARASGLDVIALYGDMEAGVGLSHEDAYRLVAVLRKQG